MADTVLTQKGFSLGRCKFLVENLKDCMGNFQNRAGQAEEISRSSWNGRVILCVSTPLSSAFCARKFLDKSRTFSRSYKI